MSPEATELPAVPLRVWEGAAPRERARWLERPPSGQDPALVQDVREILRTVRAGGDRALIELTARFDGVALGALRVDPAEFRAARARVQPEDRRALELACAHLEAFHAAQRREPLTLETAPGVRCERLTVALEAVGLYAPAGSAPLPSTVLMLGVPARLAGCPTRILCTPPRRDGSLDPAILVAAELAGIDTVLKLGGAQAVAAMAFGTASVPRVQKIFGPGNRWVTAAKELVAADPDGAAIDLPAGPSEVLVVADGGARADFVAADLLAQAEHGPDSQVLLVTPERALAGAVGEELARQLACLPRAAIAAQALAHARLIVTRDLEQALAVSNAYAPEHLILNVERPRRWLASVRNAGAVFLGRWSPESVGDYSGGTNHVLPTGGSARTASGLGLRDFQKEISVQELSPEGLRGLGEVTCRLARLERLEAHARAVDLRLGALRAEAQR